MSKTLILIPSRLSATRLPGKPLIKIGGKTIISRVLNIAKSAMIGEVYVATEDKRIFDHIKKNNGKAILTKKTKTGSDRIYEAYKKLNIKGVEYILNLQGDEPFVKKKDLIKLNKESLKKKTNVSTLACKINNKDLTKENIVKVITKNKISNNMSSKALNFSRIIENKKKKNIYHHIGIYLFKVSILKKFFLLKQSKKEKKNKLEQLRFLDNNIDINVFFSKNRPIGIDTKNDLKKAKKFMERNN